MSRFLAVLFDLQCLTIQHLSNWSDIQAILNLYPPGSSQYRRAANCVRQIIRDPQEWIGQTKIDLDQLGDFHQLEVVDYLVDIAQSDYTAIFNQLSHLQVLTFTSSRYTVYEIISAFFQNPLRQQQGHLTFYAYEQPFY